MGIYKQGLNRKQQLMFPPSLDELVDEDNVVRAIEEYVNILDISKLNIKTKKERLNSRTPIVQVWVPFSHGTIKRTLGWDHFLVRTKKKVLGENALIMFTYNFKRLLNLIGITLFKKLCKAIKNNDLTQIREEIALHISLFLQNISHFYTTIFYRQYFYKKVRI